MLNRIKKLYDDGSLSYNQIILILSVCITLFYNNTFFLKVLSEYKSIGVEFHTPALLSVIVVFTAVTHLFLTLTAFRIWFKPYLIIVLILAASIRHFTDSYGTIMDQTMILNVTKTDTAEVIDLLTIKCLWNLIIFGVLPSLIIYKIRIAKTNFSEEITNKFKHFFISLLLIFAVLLTFNKFYASFLREHKSLRYYSNPVYFFYSLTKYAFSHGSSAHAKVEKIGLDARISKSATKRKLVIMVVGESARADHFSINGYSRRTNPHLEKVDLVSFINMASCGTSTAISVPCMFSDLTRKNFSKEKFDARENLIDVLTRTQSVGILWRDNNSDSKGVAIRAQQEDYKSEKTNKICDTECRDVGMLEGLQAFIDSSKTKDIFIILHQMGNHGPAYYKRYPKAFEKFKPACHSNELENCTREEIANAYDNVILYTDYFLHKTIQILKNNNNKFETALLYISDHGESLGENGIYLHGIPYAIAPDEQKKVAAFIWLGSQMKNKIDFEQLKNTAMTPLSHDNVFHSVLGLFNVETKMYNPQLDILTRIQRNK